MFSTTRAPRFLRVILCALLLGVQLRVGRAFGTDWISDIIQQVQTEDVSTNKGQTRTVYREDTIPDFLSNKGPLLQLYAPVLENMGLTDWGTLEESYVDLNTQQDVVDALAVCRVLLKEARRRKMDKVSKERRNRGVSRPAALRGDSPEGADAIDGAAGVKLDAHLSSLQSGLEKQLDSIQKQLQEIKQMQIALAQKGAAFPGDAAKLKALRASSMIKQVEPSGTPVLNAETEPGKHSPAKLMPTIVNVSPNTDLTPQSYSVPDSVKHYDPSEELPVGEKWKRQMAGEQMTIQIKGVETLAEAADRVNDRGRIVLLTTMGLNWALTALNAVYFLGEYGFHGVLAVLSSERECEHYLAQKVVPVPTCTWVELSHSPTQGHSWPGNRMLWLEQLARMGYQVLMADTDICYAKDPFDDLELTGATVVTSGALMNFNLGALYANGRNPAGTEDLGMLTEMNRRMRALKEEAKRPGQVADLMALNDQNLVNDVLQEWISKRETYARTCALAHLENHPGACFSKCCDPLQKSYAGEALVEYIHQDMDAIRRNKRAGNETVLVEMASLGHCLQAKAPDAVPSNRPGMGGKVGCGKIYINDLQRCSEFGVVHMNTCLAHDIGAGEEGYTRDDPEIAGHHNHFQWLRENCWAPGLTELASQWIMACKTPACKKEHPDAPPEMNMDHDRTARDEF